VRTEVAVERPSHSHGVVRMVRKEAGRARSGVGLRADTGAAVGDRGAPAR
jgi:hypothetical protein